MMPEDEGIVVDNGEGEEKMPTVIIQMEPIGAPEARTESISVSALEELAKGGDILAQKLPEEDSKYFFERNMGGRIDTYPFNPEKRTLKICRGAKEGVPIGDIQILHKSVSREKHATIGYNGGECVLKDVGSKNGTYVNGIKLDKPYSLRSGDVVKFGDAELVYRERKR